MHATWESWGKCPNERQQFLGSAVACLVIVMAQGASAVSGATSTTTALSVSPSTSLIAGTPVALEATVDAGGLPGVNGTVRFLDGTRTMGEAQVVYSGSAFASGTANIKLVLAVGPHLLHAAFLGTARLRPSSSAVTSITVGPALAASGTNIGLTSTGSPGSYTLQAALTGSKVGGLAGNIIFTDQSNTDLQLGTVGLDPATSKRGWQSFTASVTASSSYAVLIGDLNNDGIPDLITSNYGGTTVSAFLGNGDGTFQSHVDYGVGAFPFGIALGDVNGDGIADLAVASHNASVVRVLLGNGDGTFQPALAFTTSGTSQYVVIADFDDDGFLDLATCSGGGSSLSILLGNGDGTFNTQQSAGNSSLTYGMVAADFNSDGFPDLAVSNNSAGTVSLFLGNGDGTFQRQTDYPVNAGPTTIVAGDLNNDGALDLAVGYQSNTMVSILLGNGDGTFRGKADYAGSNSPWGVVLADVDGDGNLDVIAASPSGRSIAVFRGKGDGTLLGAVSIPTGAANYVPAIGDLNGDGIPDVAVPNIAAANVFTAIGTTTTKATLGPLLIPGGGWHDVVASYPGDVLNAPSVSQPLTLLGSLFDTETALNASPASAGVGQTFFLVAGLSPFASSGYSASGTVTFAEGNAVLGSPVSVVNGSASLSKSDFASGVHSLTASYSGDGNFSSSVSPPFSVTVTLEQTVTFVAIPNVIYGSAPLQLIATSSSQLPVAFRVVSGPGAVSGNVLVCSGAGNIVLEASQGGNLLYQPAAPVQRTVVADKASSTLAIVSSANTVNAGTAVTFTATLSPANLAEPAGDVAFIDGATKLGGSPLIRGTSVFAATSLSPGTHSITAMYSGDSNFLASASQAVSETVVAPDFTLSATPDVLKVARGGTGTAMLTIAPAGGFAGRIQLSCGTLPIFTSCSFTPAGVTLAGDNVPQMLRFALHTAAASTSDMPAANGSLFFGGCWLSGIAGLSLVYARRGRKWTSLRMRVTLLSLVTIGTCGCGGGVSHQAPPGTVTVELTASVIGTVTSHSAPITVTIAE